MRGGCSRKRLMITHRSCVAVNFQRTLVAHRIYLRRTLVLREDSGGMCPGGSLRPGGYYVVGGK